MKRFIQFIAVLFIANMSWADWWYVDQFPWIWSHDQQCWEYSLNSRIPLWSQSCESVHSLGWEGDIRAAVHGNCPELLFLLDDDLNLCYALSGLPGMWVQFGGEIGSEVIYAYYSITYHDYANVVGFFVSGADDPSTLSFSLILEFTSPTTGRYTLQGVFPDRENDPRSNRLYSSSGEFQT